jgi:hypothetical protein
MTALASQWQRRIESPGEFSNTLPFAPPAACSGSEIPLPCQRMTNDSEVVGEGNSDVALFLHSLANTGRAVVSSNFSETDDSDAMPVLEQIDTAARAEYALELPTFSDSAAIWGARLFHQLCRFVACREIEEDQIKAACAIQCPQPRSPETDWSVDLTMRHLPRLFQMARHLSNADPLIEQMKIIAVAWPLSSVGIPELDALHVDSFIGHPALRRIYADRIIAEGDISRLGDERLDDILRGDLGIHRNLAPDIAGKLFATT